MYAHLARGLDDVFHGKLRRVSDQFLHSLAAARDSSDVNAPLIAWFAAEQAANFRRSDPTLYQRWKPFSMNAIREPRAIGWRARSKLVDLWQDEAWSEARKDVLDEAVLLHGCASELRLAGPFGRSEQSDITRSFAAEAPGPWPTSFPEEEGASEPPLDPRNGAPRLLHRRQRPRADRRVLRGDILRPRAREAGVARGPGRLRHLGRRSARAGARPAKLGLMAALRRVGLACAGAPPRGDPAGRTQYLAAATGERRPSARASDQH